LSFVTGDAGRRWSRSPCPRCRQGVKVKLVLAGTGPPGEVSSTWTVVARGLAAGAQIRMREWGGGALPPAEIMLGWRLLVSSVGCGIRW
jgi:hypothetical protein